MLEQSLARIFYDEMVLSLSGKAFGAFGLFSNDVNDMNVNDMWFQQDGTTCDAARETITLLHTKFLDRVIS